MAAVPMKTQPIFRVKTPLFLLGVALALLAFIAMFWIGSVFSSQTQGPQTAVVVAATDIQSRTPITPDMLAVKQLPASAIGPTSFTSAGQLTGYSALITILKGQPITSNLVSSQPDQLSIASSSYLPIPTGYVALTLPTNEQQGVSGYVAQGDYIDVIASVNTNLFAQSTQHVVTRTVFNRVRVIRVGPPSDSAKQGAALGLASSLTVVLSLCDAQYMQWLIINATLNYTLLSYHDYGPATFTPDASCPSTGMPSAVGPAQVDNRWGFTKV